MNGLPTGPPLAVNVLVLDPDNGNLFAGTAANGVYHSTDSGETWQPVNQGLHAKNVKALILEPGSKTLFAGTSNGVFRFHTTENTRIETYKHNDSGQVISDVDNMDFTYIGSSGDHTTLRMIMRDDYIHPISISRVDFQATTGQFNSQQPMHITFYMLERDNTWHPRENIPGIAPDQRVRDIGITSNRNILWCQTAYGIWVSRAGEAWLPVVTLDPAWQVLNVEEQDDHLLLNVRAGSNTILSATIPKPLVWSVPLPYLKFVLPTQQLTWWAESNIEALFIDISLVILGIACVIVFGVLRPGRLGVQTAVWLTYRPRHILAAFAYPNYAERWRSRTSLEQLIILVAPVPNEFSLEHLTGCLQDVGAAMSTGQLRVALGSLKNRGLVAQHDGTWRLTDPRLAEVHRREISGNVVRSLIEQTHQETPFYANTWKFLSTVGFDVCMVDSFGLLCNSDQSLWKDIEPLYVRLVMERTLDLAEFLALCDATEAATSYNTPIHTAAIVIDRPPLASDLHQIFALRTQRGLTIFPLPHSVLLQAMLDRNEREVLRDQIDLYTGRTDLYDIRSAVSDVLSFFGRNTDLNLIHKLLTTGRSVIVYGVRKIGKSSVMGCLQEECAWPVASIDLESHPGSLASIATETLRAWCLTIQQKFPHLEIPEHLCKVAQDTATHETVAPHHFRQFVGTLLSLLETCPGQPGLTLFLDEMDTLFRRPEYYEFTSILRGIAEESGGRFSLLITVYDTEINKLDRIERYRNPFFAFFNEVALGPLSQHDTQTMIISIGGQMNISYTDEALDYLVATGGGHPFLTRQLCSYAVKDLERPSTVDLNQAKGAVHGYMRMARNYIAESLWNIGSGGPPPDEALVLKTIAESATPLPEQALFPGNLALESLWTRQQAIDHLSDQSLIRQTEVGWEITIPLYRSWIRRYISERADETDRA